MVTEAYPWFDGAVSEVAQAHSANRLAHGLLIDVPEGWGSEILLSHLATLLLEAAAPVHAETAHPDLTWLAPAEAEIKVDEIRRFSVWAANRPSRSACKVGVIQHAHRMNTAAANALLKTLEEPPPDTFILVQSGQPAQLLPTVRSRCQRVPFAAQAGTARAWLEDNYPDALGYLPEVGGSPLTAVALLQAGGRSVMDDLAQLTAVDQRDAALKTLLADDVPAWLARWHRLVVARVAESPKERASYLPFLGELQQIRRQIERTNSANARLLLERLIYRWQRL